jgi:hypothetical protein
MQVFFQNKDRMGVLPMARSLKIEYPGAFYHVMHRGNAG